MTENNERFATLPEDILPESVECTVIGGIEIRKGTVAAFLQNAKRWLDIGMFEEERSTLGNEMTRSVPALRALGLFDVLTVRDEQLRALIERS